jgi:hypothetical protein
VSAVLAVIDSSEARAKLARLLTAVLKNQSGSEEVLMSRSVITRMLEDSDERFEEVRSKHNDTAVSIIRDYGSSTMTGKVGYFVTGIKSCLDAQISDITKLRQLFDAGLEIPLSEALGQVLPVTGNINIDLKLAKESLAKVMTKFTADEERIFAIQTRRVVLEGGHFRGLLRSSSTQVKMKDFHRVPRGRGLLGSNDSSDDDEDEEGEAQEKLQIVLANGDGYEESELFLDFKDDVDEA